MSHIGSYLKGKLGGYKAPKPPRRDYEGNRSQSDDSENDESYLDPTTVHPTDAPAGGPIMPSYPPPRPNHSPGSHRVQDQTKRDSVPVTFGQQNKPTAKPRSHRPQSAEDGLQGRGQLPNQTQKLSGDDYCEPWDAKPAQSLSADMADYWDPCDKIPPAPQVGRKSSKDDYCDPYDAKTDDPTQVELVRVTKEKIKKQSNNEDSDEENYDDPYDTGKVTLLDEQSNRVSIRGMRMPSVEGHQLTERDEKRGRRSIDNKTQSPSRDQRPADDYDAPWESKSPYGIRQTSPSLTRDKPQAPSYDDRPGEDYEKPWEWNKKSALNGDTQPPQSPKVDARPAEDYDAPWEWSKIKNRVAMVQAKEGEVQWSAAAAASAPKKPPRTFVEEDSVIDPKLPLEQQGWYHGPLKRLEAETLLKESEDCSFLLRNSESSKNGFSLSVKNNNSFMHLKIVCEQNKYILGQFSKPFDTVPEMIHYYSVNKLNIKGAIHKKLLHPIMEMPEYQTLEPMGLNTAM